MKKFELTDEKKDFFGTTLFRIKALVDFGMVRKGELGGFIEKESNLDHDGNAWVYGNAWVSGDARVYGDSRVYGNARVSGDAWVYGNAWVSGDAWVYGSLKIKLKAILCSRFNFEFGWQVKLWLKKEKEYEAEVERKLKEGDKK